MSAFTLLLRLVCTLVVLLPCCAPAPTLPISCQSNLTSPVSSSCSATSSLRVDLGKLGDVLGAPTLGGAAQRFTLPFAKPPVGELRFASPQPVASLSKSKLYDATSMPRACMQLADPIYGTSDDKMSEDCLYLTLYRPSAGTSTPKPVVVWIHGGSFVSGSSRAPGLDGSFLASSQDVIVVVLQYRLGMSGFFSPGQFLDETSAIAASKVAGNQGLRDVVLALHFLQDNVGAFGADPHRVTVAGQSSGAHMVRALLSVPAAQPLFHRAILHSDPANYGTQSPATSDIVSLSALAQSGCSNLACLRSKSASEILAYSSSIAAASMSLDPSIAPGQAWRPFAGSFTGPTFERDPAASAAALSGKPLVITTVANEGGSLVGKMVQPSSRSTSFVHLTGQLTFFKRSQLLAQAFGADRSAVLDTCSQYSQPRPSVPDGLRRNLETILTQGVFTCPAWYNARRYALNGAVYLATFQTGVRYPSNRGNAYCTTPGTVCHEDDILALFADPASLDRKQRLLAQHVQSRWSAFIHTGNPNPDSSHIWNPVSSAHDSVSVLHLTSSPTASTQVSLTSGPYAGCAQIWTSQLEFDWQLYA